MSTWQGREIVDLLTDIIDREIVDPEGVPLGRVDDLELRSRDDGRTEVVALLTGTVALEPRLPRWALTLIRASARLTGGPDDPRRIPIEAITKVDTVVSITAAAAAAAASPSEERLKRKIIGRIPGADHASE
ncbi:hypothetical protein K3N28_03360 [Glycomyces sp. TRM65418]|uniref:hypothetical protein n=1 Tax=Glycomyces sp. TRM65418 TaxID=2867006 RepID=UPI001CE5A45E|nr:hypothetical protein [Glycomyces sp. TRM65418]MCC3762109.1 hypothetical protein [Glycomyces sp. TRM65418]QZD56176.1 hypothetical protein K3N28_03340 [Glycomyces sp. TRM65418]